MCRLTGLACMAPIRLRSRRVRIAVFINASVVGNVTCAADEPVIGRRNWPQDLCA
jgi:hypothetical protein